MLDCPNCTIGYSYHNHSTFSDGKNTMEEMLLAAKQAGIREYGFSDHWVILPVDDGSWKRWAMPPELIGDYLDTARRLQEKYTTDDFRVKVGLEVDYFHENWEQIAEQLETFKLDYVIGASHYAGTFSVDGPEEPWTTLSQQQIDDVYEVYWNKIETMAKLGVFDILAHIDICKIYCYPTSCDSTAHAMNVLKYAKESGTIVEINTAGWDKKCGVFYPAPALIKEALRMGVKMVVSADAHKVTQVTRHFDEVATLIK